MNFMDSRRVSVGLYQKVYDVFRGFPVALQRILWDSQAYWERSRGIPTGYWLSEFFFNRFQGVFQKAFDDFWGMCWVSGIFKGVSGDLRGVHGGSMSVARNFWRFQVVLCGLRVVGFSEAFQKCFMRLKGRLRNGTGCFSRVPWYFEDLRVVSGVSKGVAGVYPRNS